MWLTKLFTTTSTAALERNYFSRSFVVIKLKRPFDAILHNRLFSESPTVAENHDTLRAVSVVAIKYCQCQIYLTFVLHEKRCIYKCVVRLVSDN